MNDPFMEAAHFSRWSRDPEGTLWFIGHRRSSSGPAFRSNWRIRVINMCHENMERGPYIWRNMPWTRNKKKKKPWCTRTMNSSRCRSVNGARRDADPSRAIEAEARRRARQLANVELLFSFLVPSSVFFASFDEVYSRSKDSSRTARLRRRRWWRQRR